MSADPGAIYSTNKTRKTVISAALGIGEIMFIYEISLMYRGVVDATSSSTQQEFSVLSEMEQPPRALDS